MRQHHRMECLRPAARLPPLEEIDCVRAHRHMRQCVTQQLVMAFARVDWFPLHARRGGLHQVPRLAARDRRHKRIRAQQLIQRGFALIEVVVVGHKIHFGAPLRVIHCALVSGDHEVRGDRLVWADRGDRIPLRTIAVEQRVIAEPFKIELLRRVHHRVRAHVPGQQHLLETAHLLRPERRAPSLIELPHRAVFALAPCAECAQSLVGVVMAIVPPILIAHMPRGHRRIVAIPFGEPVAQFERVLAEYGA